MMRRWGGLYLLVALFLASWVGQFLFQMAEVRSDAAEHGRPFEMSDVLVQFGSATFENWQSEWLQLAVQSLVLAIFARRLFTRAAEEELQTVKDAVREVLAEQRTPI